VTRHEAARDPLPAWAGFWFAAAGLSAAVAAAVLALGWQPTWQAFPVLAVAGVYAGTGARMLARWKQPGRGQRLELISLVERARRESATWLDRDAGVLLGVSATPKPGWARTWLVDRVPEGAAREVLDAGEELAVGFETFACYPFSSVVLRITGGAMVSPDGTARPVPGRPGRLIRWRRVALLARAGLLTADPAEVTVLLDQLSGAEPVHDEQDEGGGYVAV